MPCFQDTLNLLYDCSNDTEKITHFFLHSWSFYTSRQTLLNNIRNINEEILSRDEDQLLKGFCMVILTVTLLLTGSY